MGSRPGEGCKLSRRKGQAWVEEAVLPGCKGWDRDLRHREAGAEGTLLTLDREKLIVGSPCRACTCRYKRLWSLGSASRPCGASYPRAQREGKAAPCTAGLTAGTWAPQVDCLGEDALALQAQVEALL